MLTCLLAGYVRTWIQFLTQNDGEYHTHCIQAMGERVNEASSRAQNIGLLHLLQIGNSIQSCLFVRHGPVARCKYQRQYREKNDPLTHPCYIAFRHHLENH